MSGPDPELIRRIALHRRRLEQMPDASVRLLACSQGFRGHSDTPAEWRERLAQHYAANELTAERLERGGTDDR